MKLNVKCIFYEIISCILYVKSRSRNKKKEGEQIDKTWRQYMLMCRWMEMKQQNISVADILYENGYSNIAIYGMNQIGMLLEDELKNSKVNVAYGIDKNAESICSAVDIFRPEDLLTDADAVLVTAISSYTQIKDDLSKKLNCKIISMEDVI